MAKEKANGVGNSIFRLIETPRGKVVLLTAAWAGHALGFLTIHPRVGSAVAALAILPILATSRAFGVLAGLVSGLVAFLVNLILMGLAGEASSEMMDAAGLLGSGLLVLIGAVAGGLRDSRERVREELAKRKRMQEALERQNAQLATLNGISRTLASSLDTKDMLEEALSQTVGLLDAAAGVIILTDAEIGNLQVAAHIGMPDAWLKEIDDWKLQRLLCALIDREGDTLRVEDPGDDRSLSERATLETGFQSKVGVPIVHGGQPLGALWVFDSSANGDEGAARTLLSTIGQQLGVSIGRARLLDETAREREVARSLLNTAKMLSTTLRFDQLLERVLNQLQKILPYDRASVILVQDEYCQTAASRGPNSPIRGEMSPLRDRPQIELVVEERRPLTLRETEERLTEYELSAEMVGLRSWLAVPLIAQDKVVGVLTMGSAQRVIDEEGKKQAVLAFAHQAGLAIENSRLYEQMRSQLRDVTILQEVTAAISSTLDVDQVLPYVAHSLCEILSGSSVEILGLDESGRIARTTATHATRRATEQEQQVEAGRKEFLEDIPGTAEALNQNRPVQMQLKDPGLDPRVRAKLEEREAQALLLLPVVTHDRALGVLRVWDSTTARRFTRREMATGQTLAHQTAFAMENARLLEETQRRANRLAGAADIARHATAIMDQDRLLEVVVDLIQEQFGFRLASVFLIDEVSDELYPAAATDDFREIIPNGYRQRVGCGAIGKAAESGETVLVTEASEDDVAIKVSEWLSPSSMSMPIQIGGVVLGVLEVEADKVHAFDENDQLALEIIADQIAIAYQNAELLAETRSRMTDLRLLHDVSLAAASSSHLQETLQAAAEVLATEWKGTEIALQLIDEGKSTLEMKASVGYPRDGGADLDLPLGKGITGWVAKHGKPALAPDVRQDSRYYEASPSTRSELCVPMTTGGKIIGTLNVESPKINAFSADDQRLLTTLASNLAILIERARLFEEVEAARAELEQRAKALEGANARLKELDRLKSQFLANMSHELRTPLNSVIGFSEVLIDGLLGEMPPEQKECVENILLSGEHLMALINDVLDLSKIEAGHMELAPRPLDVKGLIEDVEKTVEPMFKEKSQALTIDCQDDHPPLTADRVRLRQILLNLLSNAHKFTPNGGEITLSCSLVDDATMGFSVVDTGVGIKPEDQEIIFEEFRQADGTAAREVEGTGLGLAISKRLVEMHDGSIWLESDYGEGTTFSFLLPLDGPSPTDERSHQRSKGNEMHISTRPPVLLIEANRLFNNLLTVYLRRAGYEPIQLYDGKRGLEEAREWSPLLIILDVEAAKENEWEILRRLKSDPKTEDIPVVLISALEDGKKALSLGTGEYVGKAVDQERLEVLVSQGTNADSASGPSKVLIVDDGTGLLSHLREMVPNNGHSLIRAGHDEEMDNRAPDGERTDLTVLRGQNRKSQKRAGEENETLTPDALVAEIQRLGSREQCLE
jgi:signal transduction histidine kinase/CheY-like chemotaxis protein